jgi:uncharacterized membrane protein YhaH (DUF805 family)
MKWYLKVLKQYADFNGRARRTEYWMFQLFSFLVIIGIGLLASLMKRIVGSDTALFLAGILILVYLIAIFIPSLAVTVRRLHDQNKSGWFLLMQLIPWVGGIIIFVFMVSDGTMGSNEYGPDPKDPYSDLEEIGK